MPWLLNLLGGLQPLMYLIGLVEGPKKLDDFLGQNLGFTTGLQNLGTSVAGKYLGTNMTGAERESAELNVQNQLRLARELPQAQVEGAERAGINPAFALTGGSVSNPSNTASTSAGAGSLSDLIALATLPAQLKNLNAQTANITADTAKKEVESEGVSLDNAFKDSTLSARAEGVKLANSLTRATESKVYKELEQIENNAKLAAEQAKTEESKREANFAAALLSRMNAHVAIELLPYTQALEQAQTQAQKNYAGLMAVQTLYQNKILNSGYIDAMISQLKASATSAEARAAVDQINSDIRTGKFGNDGSFLGKVGSSLLSGTVLALDQLKGLASVGLHFGKSLNKSDSKPSQVINDTYDPFGYMNGE